MMRAPIHGWCMISIADRQFGGSYLEDYPYTISEALLTALEKTFNRKCNSQEHLSYFTIEMEPGIVTVIFCPEQIEIKDGYYKDVDELSHFIPMKTGYLYELADELCHDLNDYYEEWVDWMWYGEDDADITLQREKDIAGFITQLYKYSVTRPLEK